MMIQLCIICRVILKTLMFWLVQVGHDAFVFDFFQFYLNKLTDLLTTYRNLGFFCRPLYIWSDCIVLSFLNIYLDFFFNFRHSIAFSCNSFFTSPIIHLIVVLFDSLLPVSRKYILRKLPLKFLSLTPSGCIGLC